MRLGPGPGMSNSPMQRLCNGRYYFNFNFLQYYNTQTCKDAIGDQKLELLLDDVNTSNDELSEERISTSVIKLMKMLEVILQPYQLNQVKVCVNTAFSKQLPLKFEI